jgi:hypothetical protein
VSKLKEKNFFSEHISPLSPLSLSNLLSTESACEMPPQNDSQKVHSRRHYPRMRASVFVALTIVALCVASVSAIGNPFNTKVQIATRALNESTDVMSGIIDGMSVRIM